MFNPGYYLFLCNRCFCPGRDIKWDECESEKTRGKVQEKDGRHGYSKSVSVVNYDMMLNKMNSKVRNLEEKYKKKVEEIGTISPQVLWNSDKGIVSLMEGKYRQNSISVFTFSFYIFNFDFLFLDYYYFSILISKCYFWCYITGASYPFGSQSRIHI
jgi:hypothetical protein